MKGAKGKSQTLSRHILKKKRYPRSIFFCLGGIIDLLGAHRIKLMNLF